MNLVEAYDGMELVAGKAVIAPGGMHLRVKQILGKIYASVSDQPLDSLYPPSVDLLFESAAEHISSVIEAGLTNSETTLDKMTSLITRFL